MKKSFMNNIINFVDSNVRQRIDRPVNNANDFLTDHLLLVERHFEDLKNVCIESEKRISLMLHSINPSTTLVGSYTHNVQASLSNLTASTPQSSSSANNYLNSETPIKSKHFNSMLHTQNNAATNSNSPSLKSSSHYSELTEHIRKHKKLPIVGYLKFLIKSNNKPKPDSILANTFSRCSKLQTQLTKLYLAYEQKVELHCLKPIQQIIETDVPNVVKLRKIFIKSQNDFESVRAKYNGANLKQQVQHQQNQSINSTVQNIAQYPNTNKIEQLKKELDETLTRYEQARDTYATELYTFVCKETDLVKLFKDFYQYQAEYHQQVTLTIQGSLPLLDNILVTSPRKSVFGLSLNEHLSHTGRSRSLVIDLCIHILYANGLTEEGLFRIPGSSIKIKNLKNAINAWFVTLANQNELSSDVQSFTGVSCSASVIAVYNLFKHVAGRKPPKMLMNSDCSQQASIIVSRDDNDHNDSSALSGCKNQQLVFDVHTVAGLLKLYLRELPEPLFTHALYDRLIEVTVKTMKNEHTDISLGDLISKLPKTNYENLSHLIRFLHLLTCHRDQNKMTATNLAIAIAPSLIWARPQMMNENQMDVSNDQLDDIQMLNMQMSNIGMSASLHAMVIEYLINNSENIFPDEAQFNLSELSNYEESLYIRSNLIRQDRFQNSASPTGLSTASSSSYSSTSSKGKHKKGGSMEGLLNDNMILSTKPQLSTSSRPLSVNLTSYIKDSPTSGSQKPPPVPPSPAARSHLRKTSDQLTHRTFSSHQKPPAPPPPPTAISLQRKTKEDQSKEQNDDDQNQATPTLKRSIGTSNIMMNTVRPSVPPPDRPLRSVPLPNDVMDDGTPKKGQACQKNDITLLTQEDRSLNSPSDSDLRLDLESNSADDDVDLSMSNSPSVSISSTEDVYNDSSLENASPRLADSCDHDEISSSSSKKEGTLRCDGNKTLTDLNRPYQIDVEEDPTSKVDSFQLTTGKSSPPAKPPRSTSPKSTQSTPL